VPYQVLDNRTWLIWGIAASLPALIGRNPVVLAELLLIVVTVRLVTSASQEWAWAIRVVSIFVAISVVFNVLTVHSGDRELGRMPDLVPLIGGEITLNAVIYGVISGIAIFTIVLVWTHVAAHLSWSSLMRQVPSRFAHVAVAGSVAWSYLPSMRRTLRDIRETQAARGWVARRARDLPGLIVPVLAGGLERSMITAEVLETRGFGGAAANQQRSSSAALRLLGGLLGLVSGMYCLAVGQSIAALALIATGGSLFVLEARKKHSGTNPTRLRDSQWTQSDTACVICSVSTIVVVLASYARNASVLTFNPYPILTTPSVNLVLLTSLLPLFAPAIVTVISEP
jgi:energy-coupling factor transport system permease protein